LIIGAAAAENWEEKVIMELNDISEYFADCTPLLDAYMKDMKVKLGLSDNKILALIHKLYPGAKIGA
jgi:hypothetical protein